MGYGYVASPHNTYEGTLKLGGSKEIEPGIVVTADFKAGTAEPKAVADTKIDKLYFVAQENDTPVEYGVDDVEQKIKPNTYLKLIKLFRGVTLVTTMVTGNPAVGDAVKIKDDGSFEKDSAAGSVVNLVVREIRAIGTKKAYVLEYLV